MKAINKIIVIFLAAVVCMEAHGLNHAIGQWQIYGAFSAPPQKVIETKDIVYYVSGGGLFSYDKRNDESYTYTIGNKLKDINISDIHYNFEKRYLVVIYKSMNMDLIYDDGRVVNLSDISEAEIDGDHSINSVYFDGDDMYVCTTYGLTQYNIPRAEVRRSGIYHKSIRAAVVLGDKLIIHDGTKYMFIEKGKDFPELSRFTAMNNYDYPVELVPINDTQALAFMNNPRYEFIIINFDFDTAKMWGNVNITQPHTVISPYLIHGEGGKLYFTSDGALYGFDEDYKEMKLCDLPEEFENYKVGTYKGSEKVYSLGRDGLGCHGFDGEGGTTLYMDRYMPEKLSVSQPYFFYPSADGRNLYIRNVGSTSYKFNLGGNLGRTRVHNASRISLETGEATDMTLYPIETVDNTNKYNKLDKYATAVSSMVADPDDEDKYYISTTTEGVYVVKGGKLVGKYDDQNAPFAKLDNRFITYGLTIDRGGNLWVRREKNASNPGYMIILPADKRKLDPAQVKAEDWVVAETGDYVGGQEVRFLVCKKSNWIFEIDHANNQYFLACDTKGTFNDLSDDEFYAVDVLTDQDGKVFDPVRRSSIVEDHNGKIWIGTGEGIFEVDPSKINSNELEIKRIKVPRNDGTDLADYLVGADLTYDISVDASNRKWIATNLSGIYLVNADGSEILKNFTQDNSPLPSNLITALYADPNGSVLFVGTETTLLSYGMDSAPPSEDFNNVLAYPNPVRPEYKGNIYIKGLMDNTLVKICDSMGSVLYQGRSEGGLFSWSGNDRYGNRVKSGVYYVYLSENASGGHKGAVTKIMVIN